MASNKVLKLWANMVRQLDIEMIVPQHGAIFKGKEMVERFINWIENLQVGVDLPELPTASPLNLYSCSYRNAFLNREPAPYPCLFA
jgi:hypothetical protein